jgi:hypothetical protein
MQAIRKEQTLIVEEADDSTGRSCALKGLEERPEGLLDYTLKKLLL